MAGPAKVGVLVGREWSWPPQFIETVNKRNAGVVAEYVKLGGTRMNEPVPYAVVIDRISHEVPYYRSYLKHAVLQGDDRRQQPVHVDGRRQVFRIDVGRQARRRPARRPSSCPTRITCRVSSDTKACATSITRSTGKRIVEYVGMPCVLKDAHGGGWKEVYICQTHGRAAAPLQPVRPADDGACRSSSTGSIMSAACAWGSEEVLPMRVRPARSASTIVRAGLSDAGAGTAHRRAIRCKLVRALGYDMNTVEWAIRDGVPYAIDFMNPAPDMDVNSLTPHYFEWAVKHMADLAIRLAKSPRPQLAEMRWSKMFQA